DLERRRYMEVYAKLQEALEGEEVFRASRGIADSALTDRQRLCLYYTIDWICSQGKERFSVAQIIDTVKQLNLGSEGAVALPDRVAQSVISLLVARAFIERADRELTWLGQSNLSMYRLAPWVLLAFQGSDERDWRSDDGFHRAAGRESLDRETIGKYRVVEKIGVGGFASVYKVTDGQGQTFAAKVLHRHMAAGSNANVAITLFHREIETLRLLEHP